MSEGLQQEKAVEKTTATVEATKPAPTVLDSVLDETKRIAMERQCVEVGEDGQLHARYFEGLQRIAKMYAESSLVPDHLKGKVADIAILLQLASRLRVEPFSLIQKAYVVHGKPGFEAPFLIGLLNSSGKLDGRLKYRIVRDESGAVTACTAYAKEKATGETVEGSTITWAMVQAWGWDKPKKDGPSMWARMPEQMFMYRSAAFFARSHFPDVTLGMHTTDELIDTFGADEAAPAGFAAVSTPPGQPVAPPAPILTAPPVATPSPEAPAPTPPKPANALEQTIQRRQAEAAAAPGASGSARPDDFATPTTEPATTARPTHLPDNPEPVETPEFTAYLIQLEKRPPSELKKILSGLDGDPGLLDWEREKVRDKISARLTRLSRQAGNQAQKTLPV